jgi:hypothetical protein
MPGYRKPGKQEAYEAAQMIASNFSDEYLPDATSTIHNHLTGSYPQLLDSDIRDVCAKAIRVERGRRIGENRTAKMSIDLSEMDRNKLAQLKAAGGHSTEVATIREAIRSLYIATFA